MTAPDTAESDREAQAGRRAARAAHWGAALLSVTAVAAAGLTAGLYFGVDRADQRTDPATTQAVIEAATTGTTAVLSYSPDTVDTDLAAAKSHLTGPFLSYYQDFTTSIMAAAIKQRQVQADVEVLQAAVAELDSDSAVVLLFINQTTVSSDRPQPARTQNSVRVTLAKTEDSWRISQLEPQ